MSLAIVPGSFDPMTLGHLDIVRRVAEKYDRVVVAVMMNSDKKYTFDMETRAEIAQLTVSDLSNVSVVTDTGLLVDLYAKLGASAVCKGVRNPDDLAYERRMADWNRTHNEKFVTEFLTADPELALISSTKVRTLLSLGDPIDGLVHPAALDLIKSTYYGG